MVTMLERSLELAMGLEHLHHHMPDTFVVHRDLKPDNVGFKADGTLKLVSVSCVMLCMVFSAGGVRGWGGNTTPWTVVPPSIHRSR